MKQCSSPETVLHTTVFTLSCDFQSFTSKTLNLTYLMLMPEKCDSGDMVRTCNVTYPMLMPEMCDSGDMVEIVM